MLTALIIIATIALVSLAYNIVTTLKVTKFDREKARIESEARLAQWQLQEMTRAAIRNMMQEARRTP